MKGFTHIKKDSLNISFAPPFIDDDVVAEVVASLKSGWITSGPKVKELEELSAAFCGVKRMVCVNSWSSGAALVFKWLGVSAGDEVIIPACTYAATALAVIHAGAKPVMVDIKPDGTIDPQKVAAAITRNTKAILSVDIAGWPCDYDALKQVLHSEAVVKKFTPNNEIQKQWGRPLLVADAAHSLGAYYAGKPVATAPDIAIFSLNAVKNITSAEGGLIALNLRTPFDNEAVYKWFKLNSMNGQTKDAFSKTQKGEWRYDIVSAGLKANLPDVCAAIGVAQLKKYDTLILPRRERVVNHYLRFFANKPWAVLPHNEESGRKSSFHLFRLRIEGITEAQRDAIIRHLADKGVAANVHFIPLPMLSLFKEMGYRMEDYPIAYDNYRNEISLPLYPQLTDEECAYVEAQVESGYEAVVNE